MDKEPTKKASQDLYTYRAGQRIELEKRPEQLVIRALPEDLSDDVLPGVSSSELQKVSSASTRITVDRSRLESVMASGRRIAPTHHAYVDQATGSDFLISDRVFVSFKMAPGIDALNAFAAKYGLILREKYSDKDFLFQLTNHTGMNPIKLVVLLTEEDDNVAAAENDVNQQVSTSQFTQPMDTDYVQHWHLHDALNHAEFDTRASTRVEEAWRLMDGFGDPDVVVCVTDDGCKLNHGDFDSAGKFAEWGYLRGSRLITSNEIDANPDEMYKAGSNHGTSCCGVIAGEVDGALTVGAAPWCRLLPIQWESSGSSLFISDSKLMTVLNFISDKVDVVSNSWGSSPFGNWPTPVLNRIRTLSQTGGRRGTGIVFMWAAGNENCPIDHRSNQDIPFTNGVEVRGGSLVWVGVKTSRVFQHNLVNEPGVMYVAAVASTARRSHYSNHGTGIAISAPSSNSHEYYRLVLPGLGISTATGDPVSVTHSFGGTSSATPLVAGIAALVISANPALSAAEVISVLKRTASKDLDFGNWPRTPPASFDPDTSWDVSPVAPFDDGAFVDIGHSDGTWSPWYGHGRVDALAAVSDAISKIAPGPGGAESFQGTDAPDRSIPDNSDKGIKSKIECGADFVIQQVRVDVEIPHTFIGDLHVTLTSPAGTSVVLHDRSGGNADDLVRAYDSTTSPALSVFAGEPA
ncbi:MAG: S8 family serine peptidase, partial [Rhodospirillales bacterium]|nr:S8 family serine peptidase [Rhodospirillales bacterium]